MPQSEAERTDILAVMADFSFDSIWLGITDKDSQNNWVDFDGNAYGHATYNNLGGGQWSVTWDPAGIGLENFFFQF